MILTKIAAGKLLAGLSNERKKRLVEDLKFLDIYTRGLIPQGEHLLNSLLVYI